MLRSLLCSLATGLLFVTIVPAQKKSALDKPVLEAYVRHLYVMGPQIKVEISDPKPSDLPGFVTVTVRASMGNQSQDLPFLVSKDGTKILQAAVYDVEQNPFKKDLDKLHTALQPSYGTAGAPVVIVAFSDFQCPHCKVEAELLRKNLLAAYPTQVRFYYKDLPLESIHPWARTASIAGRCVFRQNPAAFWEYHDFVFANQENITPENFKDKVLGWAKGVKDMDSLQLTSCIDNKATDDEVAKNVAEARELAVDSTPTLFVNGRRLPGSIEWPALRSIIDYEIEYQKTAKNAGEDCGCDTQLKLPGMTPSAAPGVPGSPKSPIKK
jgi:protein-disulfide isomerase